MVNLENYMKRTSVSALSVLISCALIFLSIKSGGASGIISISDNFIQISHNALVSEIRGNGVYVSVAALFLIVVLTKDYLSFANNAAANLFAGAVVVYILRIMFYDGSVSVRSVQALIYIILTYVAASNIRGLFVGVNQSAEEVLGGLSFYSVVYGVVNLAYFISGYGFDSQGYIQRYFGLSDHPNFLGANAAIAGIISFGIIVFSMGWSIGRVVYMAAFSCCLILVILSGSRTGALMLTSGCLFILLLGIGQRRVSGRALAVVSLLGVIFLAAYSFGVSNYSDSSERIMSTENTREDAWAEMFFVFLESPLVGSGFSPNSESSLLKAMSTGGLLVGIPFLIALGAALRLVWVQLTRCKNPPMAIDNIASSMVLAIVIGSMLEGYLLEGGGFMAVAYLVAVSILRERE
jgi:hypothetical protein